MEYNPYAERCAKLQQQISALETAGKQRLASIAWYDGFDIEEASARFHAMSRESSVLEQQRDQLMKASIPVLAKIKRLEELTSFSFDPREWFSDERKENKRQLEIQRSLETQQKKQLKAVQGQLKSNQQTRESIDGERNRYRSFDRLHAMAVQECDAAQIAQFKLALQQALTDKKRVDAKLAEPLAALVEFRKREKVLLNELSLVADIEARLSHAPNTYEKRLLHEKCAAMFGEGSPGKVKRQKQAELDSVRRNIEKLDTRLRGLSQRAVRVVRTVVIDGNNLCYEQQDRHRRMIGLGALEAAVRRLVQEYKVVIVFDSTICSLLKMTSQAITARFRNMAQVHVVPSKNGADETILDAASDPHAYVLSNDKFRDFPEKPVVRGGRLATHSIVNQKIIVHDFDINEAFAA